MKITSDCHKITHVYSTRCFHCSKLQGMIKESWNFCYAVHAKALTHFWFFLMKLLFAMGPPIYVGISFIWSSHNNTNIRVLYPQGFVLIFALHLKLQPATQIRLHCSFCCFSFSFVELYLSVWRFRCVYVLSVSDKTASRPSTQGTSCIQTNIWPCNRVWVISH